MTTVTKSTSSANATTAAAHRTKKRLFVSAILIVISLGSMLNVQKELNMSSIRILGYFELDESSSFKRFLKSDAPIMDVISVGSVLKSSYQDAQERTFGSHSSIRKFFRITEMSDTDRDCFNELTVDQMDDIVDFCENTDGASFVSGIFRTRLFSPKKHSGWICAQKRPLDGLHIALDEYRNEKADLPDYLAIIDDDTYMDVSTVLDFLQNDFPSSIPNVAAGCNFSFLFHMDEGLTFPYGGFGSYLSKRSIERLLQPIDCSSTSISNTYSDISEIKSDPFTRRACDRLELDTMGERMFFENGMSVSDLMFAFASKQPFADVENWKAGYCFHSDHALAYFINFYHIAVPDEVLAVSEEKNSSSGNNNNGDDDIANNNNENIDGNKISSKNAISRTEEATKMLDDNELRKKYKYSPLTSNLPDGGRNGECEREREECTAENALICHYIRPEQMDELFHARKAIAENAAVTSMVTSTSINATNVARE